MESVLGCNTLNISIHALREEGDPSSGIPLGVQRNFYPRPPRGGRPSTDETTTEPVVFLSTPSARRATGAGCSPDPAGSISIHALREEGDHLPAGPQKPTTISIHALREEGDLVPSYIVATANAFLSTPSARRATQWLWCSSWCSGHFYPRPPRGGRRYHKSLAAAESKFLSTPSARRATRPRAKPRRPW